MGLLSFAPKRTGETLKYSFDFVNQLASGETLSNPVVTAAVYQGTDPSTSGIVSGSASVSGTTVTQLITAGLDNVTYVLIFEADTSNSQTLQAVALLLVSDAYRS